MLLFRSDGAGDADQSQAGPSKLQYNEPCPLIDNGDGAQHQRTDDVQRQVSGVKFTPDPSLIQSICREHHESADNGHHLQKHKIPAETGRYYRPLQLAPATRALISVSNTVDAMPDERLFRHPGKEVR